MWLPGHLKALVKVSGQRDDGMNAIPHLSIEGEKFTALTLDMNVVMSFGTEGEFQLRIMEEEFELKLADSLERTTVRFAAWSTPPENVTGVTNLSTLINRTVTFAEISEIGELRITFYGGASLCVKPCGTYESYTLVGGGR